MTLRPLARPSLWLLSLSIVVMGLALARSPVASAGPRAVTACRTIRITSLPPYDSTQDLRGRVRCASPAEYDDYAVAVYIYVGNGWWNKPTFDAPLTAIGSNGRWTTDVTTGGNDAQATRIAAVLWRRAGGPPPRVAGGQLPASLLENPHVIKTRKPPQRRLSFSGYTWNVKRSEGLVGPGPNVFSDRPEDVWVDEAGRLHLTIRQRDGNWVATEVYTTRSFGYGTYTFTLASRVDNLDRNVVLGLFTWDNKAAAQNYREIDVEFARWGQPTADNAQYVVQPYQPAGNLRRFTMPATAVSTHRFVWRANRVEFSSYQGATVNPANLITSWPYTGPDVPPAGQGNARINLWLNGGTPPADGQPVEIIIADFTYAP